MISAQWKVLLLTVCMFVEVSLSSPLMDALRNELELDENNSATAKENNEFPTREAESLDKMMNDKANTMTVIEQIVEQMTKSRKGLDSLNRLLERPEFDYLQDKELKERNGRQRGAWNSRNRFATENVPENEFEVFKKRMCRVNLGGHCQTENAASLAKQMHYLNSGMSPGKRRRKRREASLPRATDSNTRNDPTTRN